MMYLFVPTAVSFIGLGIAIFKYFEIKRCLPVLSNQISDSLFVKAHKIGELIRSGGFTCITGQYTYLLIFLPVLILLSYLYLGKWIAAGIFMGSMSNILIVFFALETATSANVVTALKSMLTDGLQDGFNSAYKAGQIVSIFMVSIMTLITIAAIYSRSRGNMLPFCLGSAFGASLVSMFARLTGGVFTKAADIAADMVGKVFAHLPEDSPENPAVIADNIGDNIGDCVGTAADIFETYICSVIIMPLFPASINTIVIILTSTLICSVLSTFHGHLATSVIKRKADGASAIISVMSSMFRNSFIASTIVFLATNWFYLKTVGKTSHFISELACFLLGIGLLVTLLYLNNYYISKNHIPVQSIVKASRDSTAMNIITGFAFALQSAFIVTSAIVIFALASFFICGLHGLTILLFSLLGFIPCIMTMDTYGPVVDNAGGIAVMSGAPKSVRYNTDILDSLGNLTKSLTKGYSAGITSVVAIILISYITNSINLSQSTPLLVISSVFGSAVTFIFVSFVITAVYRGADYMTKVSIMKMKNESIDSPEYYTRPIQFLAMKSVQYSINALILPILPVLIYIPILIFFPQMRGQGHSEIAGWLIGLTASSLLLGLMMTIGGAAWDNAKKFIEDEHVDTEVKKLLDEAMNKFNSVFNTKKTFARPGYDLENLEAVSNLLLVTQNTITDDSQQALLRCNEALKLVQNYSATLKTKQKLLEDAYNQLVNDNSEKINLKDAINIIESGCIDIDDSGNGGVQVAFNNVFVRFSQLVKIRKICESAVVGDMLGDPLKDAAGVALNVLVKMSIILALFVMFHIIAYPVLV